MPKRRMKKRVSHHGARRMKGGNELSQIATANNNIKTIKRLSSAKPPLQQPGQLYRRLQQGGALRDSYGAYLYVPTM